MNRDKALAILASNKPLLAERYGVMRLALFGSTARDVANAESDIDILVAFDGVASIERMWVRDSELKKIRERNIAARNDAAKQMKLAKQK